MLSSVHGSAWATGTAGRVASSRPRELHRYKIGHTEELAAGREMETPQMNRMLILS